jgi:hypothetical protein
MENENSEDIIKGLCHAIETIAKEENMQRDRKRITQACLETLTSIYHAEKKDIEMIEQEGGYLLYYCHDDLLAALKFDENGFTLKSCNKKNYELKYDSNDITLKINVRR